MLIVGTGMACPVGLSAASACAAKRAGISAFGNLPFHDAAGETVVGAAVPGLDWSASRESRLVGLLGLALADLLDGHPNAQWSEMPVLLCLAEARRPGASAQVAGSIVKRIQEQLGVHFNSSKFRTFASGHVAGFMALQAARQLIQRGGAPGCVICGVDSFLDPATLLTLDRQFRLKTSANRDGLIPGEAAAVVLVQENPSANTDTAVIGLGFGLEQASILSGEPLLGRGLAAAARLALAESKLGLHDMDLRLSDATGELYGFKELPLVEGRLMRVVRKKAQPLWHWAEAIGDTGAAAGVAQLVLADHSFRNGYAAGARAICLTGSVDGARAAAVVRSSAPS